MSASCRSALCVCILFFGSLVALLAQTPASPPSLQGILGGGTVELGQPVTLTVRVLGGGTDGLAFQWRKAGVELPGETAISLAFAGVTAADAGTYSVRVRNAAGESVASTELSVRPLAPPVITTAPRTTIAQVGQTVTFTFVATGSYPRTYQWRRDGNPISGATGVTFSLTQLTTADAGTYSVTVTNSAGSVTSASASLTVNAATPPVIQSFSPADTGAIEGDRLLISVNLASGSSPFTYQWFKNGQPISSAGVYQLEFPVASLSDAGKYSVVVTNVAGSATSREANVVVVPAVRPVITQQPEARTYYERDSAYLAVSYTGSAPVRLQWFRDGVPLAGQTQSSLQISSVTVTDAGLYTVTVTNAAGSVTSVPARLTVLPMAAPVFTREPEGVDLTEGQFINLKSGAVGSPPITYQWFLNDVPITAAGANGEYSTPARRLEAGRYHVVARNPGGATRSRTVDVKIAPMAPPALPRQGGDSTVTLGNSLGLGSQFTLEETRSWTYQWYRNGEPIPDATSAYYHVGATRAEDAGEYYFVASNAGGSTTSQTMRVTIVNASTRPAGAWIAAQRLGNTVCFAFASPARIERFDLVTETWLPRISLPRAPSTFVATPGAFYTSAGSVVYRYNWDGTNETILSGAFSSDVLGMTAWRDYLLVQNTRSSAATVTSVRRSDGATISSQTFTYRWGPVMVAANNSGFVYSRTTGISPSDITMTTIQADGTISGGVRDSPYHGSFPDADRLFLPPNESFVADDSGTIYRSADLTLAGTLPGRVDDMDFFGSDQIVALHSGRVAWYAERFGEQGRFSVSGSPARLVLRGSDIFLFSYPVAGGAIPYTRRSMGELARPLPPAAKDPLTVGFAPDAVWMDRDGVLLLYSKLHRQIFRWSSSLRSYLASIPLAGWPNYVTYSATNHRLYLAHPDQRVTQIKLDLNSAAEEPFVTAASPILGLAAAGPYVVVNDTTSPWVSYFSYGPDGRMIHDRPWSYEGQDFVWNQTLNRLYFLRGFGRGGSLMYLEVNVDGRIGEQRELDSGNVNLPNLVRLSPDGRSVLLGSGKLHDAQTGAITASLANAVNDATWLGSRLYTARSSAKGVQLQRWAGGNMAEDGSATIGGRLLRLAGRENSQLVVVTLRDGAPHFSIFDADLRLVSSHIGGLPSHLSNLAARALVGRGDQILIPGFYVSGTEPKRVLVRAAGPALAGFNVTGALTDPQLSVHDGTGRVVASNDNWQSAPNSAEVATVTGRVGAFGFSPESRDAAALVVLSPGPYTVQASGGDGGTGVGLVEIYDAQDRGSGSRLTNIAARALVGTGSDVLIPGIVINGSEPKTVLIRAVGPGLASFGVNGTLVNPRLRLFRGNQVLFDNDDWDRGEGVAQVVGATGVVGAFPLAVGSKDAALLVRLPPGGYTAQVSGTDGGGGVALVEVYEVSL